MLINYIILVKKVHAKLMAMSSCNLYLVSSLQYSSRSHRHVALSETSPLLECSHSACGSQQQREESIQQYTSFDVSHGFSSVNNKHPTARPEPKTFHDFPHHIYNFYRLQQLLHIDSEEEHFNNRSWGRVLEYKKVITQGLAVNQK